MRRSTLLSTNDLNSAKNRAVAVLASVSLLMTLAGCAGDEGTGPSYASTVTVTETISAISTVTETVTPSVETSTNEPIVSTVPASNEPSSDGPPVLKPDSTQNRDLGLNDVFIATDGWEEPRLDVASEVDVRALAVEVDRCEADRGAGLEFRLANGFEKFAFSIGQANSLKSSDQTMKVEIHGNGKQLDTRSVPFNTIVDLSVDVRSVNALKILVYLESEPGYCNGDITAMLYKIKLS